MGSAVCKNSKVSEAKTDYKSITIGIFGLDNAGKTSVLKAMSGAPTSRMTSTSGSTTTSVAYPSAEGGNQAKTDSNQKRIQVIDVSGERKYRDDSWSNFYDQLHGWIFVIDASAAKRWRENQETLNDLLESLQLSGKPVLILANKQDRPDAIEDEFSLRRKLNLEKIRSKFQIGFCTAVPAQGKNKVDPSIRDGWSWLIRTIEDNYSSLNSRVMKTKNTRSRQQLDHSESDENNGKNRDSKRFQFDRTSGRSGYPSAINTNKLPSIHAKKAFSDDDDDDVRSSALNDSLKKKKVLGPSTVSNVVKRTSNDQHPAPFRSTYESFPEEMPWSSTSIGKGSKTDDYLPKLYSKPLMSNSARKRDVSPLVHDTKPPAYGSLARNTYYSDDDDGDGLSRYPKSNVTSRFGQSSSSSAHFTSSTKKTPSDPGYYDDDYYRTGSKSKTSKIFDSDEEKSNHHSYNGANRSGTTKGTGLSRFEEEDEDDYLPSRSNVRAPSNSLHSSFTTPKPATRSNYDDYDRSPSSSKLRSQSKYDDDGDDDDDYVGDSGYPKSNQAARSSTLSKTNYYSSSHDDRSTSASRFRSNNLYDD